MDVNRLTYALISNHVPLILIKTLIREVDESVSLHSNGRVITHVVHEMLNDLVPNYCFNHSTQRYLIFDGIQLQSSQNNKQVCEIFHDLFKDNKTATIPKSKVKSLEWNKGSNNCVWHGNVGVQGCRIGCTI